ncbi:hypothetical protein RQP46_004686 [Phenoliferia psychrophenolica]
MHSSFSIFALVATLFAVIALCGTPVSADPAPLLAPIPPAKRIYVRKHGDVASFANNKTSTNSTTSSSNATTTTTGKTSTSTKSGKNSTSTTSGKNSTKSSSSKNSSATAANSTSGKTTTTDSSDADMVISTPRLALLSVLLGMGAMAVGF